MNLGKESHGWRIVDLLEKHIQASDVEDHGLVYWQVILLQIVK